MLQWDSTVRFTLMTHDIIFGVLKIQCYEDDDDSFSDDKLGESNLPVKSVCGSQNTTKWFALYNKRNQEYCKVLLEIKYDPTPNLNR